MKLLKPSKKWLLLVLGLLVAVFILRAVLFFTAKPKITVDYVSEYNKFSLPSNYNLEDNAVPYYKKAFDAFIDMPVELECPPACSLLVWPTDLNDTIQSLLEEWLSANSMAFEYFRIGANKPYWWIEGSAEDNMVENIGFPRESFPIGIIKALLCDAKIKATKGEFKPAFENILTCYKAGKHKCRPNLLVSEQRNGLNIKQDALESAFIILDRTRVDSESLKFLQDALQEEFDNDTYIPSLQTEKYFLYDRLQRTFIDNGRGTGRIAWSNLNEEGIPEPPLILKLFACLMGPTRNDMEKLIEVNEQIDKMIAKTPWEIQQKLDDYTKEIKKIWHTNTSIGMRLFCKIDPYSCMPFPQDWFLFNLYYKTKAKTQALIAVLAILRFKNDYNRLPETLDELVSAGYLKSLPNDPYSDGPLVYKITDNNFLLYSVGKDFIDNGGVHKPGGSMAFKKGITYDIIYWPVRRFPLPQWYKSQTTGKQY